MYGKLPLTNMVAMGVVHYSWTVGCICRGELQDVTIATQPVSPTRPYRTLGH